MDIFEVINQRYSVRKFKDVDIPMEDIEKIIKAAGSAPSGKNNQNWHFVVLKNRAVIEQMVKVVDYNVSLIAGGLPTEKAERFQKFSRFTTIFGRAPVVIAVYANDYVPENYDELVEVKASAEKAQRLLKANPGMQGVGAAVENLMLAAFGMGYGGCWMTSPNHSGSDLEKVIGFKKEGYMLVALVPLGVPDGERKSPVKKLVEEIMTIIE